MSRKSFLNDVEMEAFAEMSEDDYKLVSNISRVVHFNMGLKNAT